MGFGAIIASGDLNTLLPDALVCSIAEVRVEQFLDEMTEFAIRFQDDISEGEPLLVEAPELKSEQMITIAAPVPDGIQCLVRGPITDTRYIVKLGGPGSSYEVRGQDRRVEMTRECVPRKWTGRASEAAAEILRRRQFNANVEQTPIIYGAPRSGSRQTTRTLNQESSDADFLWRIAQHYNVHFWIEYRSQANGPPGAPGLRVIETANLKSSPPRSTPSGSPGALSLVPTTAVRLRVNVEKARCQNVTAFELTEHPERPNRFARKAINEHDLEEHRTSPQDPQPPIRPDGKRFGGAKQPRDLCLTMAGNEDVLQARAESALTESGWFLEATASTTAHMLGGVLLPHDVVEVEGLGSRHSGPYQVKSVTHVINAADHFMDIELRRNAVGGR